MTSAFLQASSRLALSSGREEVSTRTMGTPSGVVSCASLVGGNTGGGCSGKDSVAAAVMSEDLPTPASPTTTILTGFAGLIPLHQNAFPSPGHAVVWGLHVCIRIQSFWRILADVTRW